MTSNKSFMKEKNTDIAEVLLRNVKALSAGCGVSQKMIPAGGAPLPSPDALQSMVDLLKKIMFHGFFDERKTNEDVRSYTIGVHLEEVFSLLKRQIARAIIYKYNEQSSLEVKRKAADLTLQFIDSVPEIRRVLYTDVEAMFDNDPAVDNYGEVIFSYPVVQAMASYRIAHRLLKLGVPVIPRIITEQAHSKTGIDIHPGAEIGSYFSIDHGTGVVIGETCVIGNHVTLYQGVTLGARNFKLGGASAGKDAPRHPVLEDNVTIYSNSTVLGHVTIGHDTVIGGNVWVTTSLPPHTTLVQGKAVSIGFTDGAGI